MIPWTRIWKDLPDIRTQICEWRNRNHPEIRTFETAIVFYAGAGSCEGLHSHLANKKCKYFRGVRRNMRIFAQMLRTNATAWEADLEFKDKDCLQGRGKVVFNAFYAPCLVFSRLRIFFFIAVKLSSEQSVLVGWYTSVAFLFHFKTELLDLVVRHGTRACVQNSFLIPELSHTFCGFLSTETDQKMGNKR